MSALSAAFIFSFQFSLLFFNKSIARPHQHCGVLLVLICNIRHRTLPKIWVRTFVVRNVQSREKTELIPTVKMETRHLVEGQFGSEFLAICNHYVVMTARSRKTWKFCEQCLRFLGKNDLYGKIFTILSRKFTWRHRLMLLCSNVVKFVRRKISEIVHYLPDKNFGCLSNCSYCADRAQNLPGPAPNNLLTMLQISSKSVHFRWTPFLPRRVFPWFTRSYASLRANNN